VTLLLSKSCAAIRDPGWSFSHGGIRLALGLGRRWTLITISILSEPPGNPEQFRSRPVSRAYCT
jgi:hypothetical protein